MKRLIYNLIVITLLCFGCAVNKHQARWSDPLHGYVPPKTASKRKVPKYVPLKEFKTDTAAYLLQSLENRKQYYIGRKFKVLLNDIELSVQFCMLNPNYLKVNGKGVYGQGNFFFSRYEAYFGEPKEKNIFSIYVQFAYPYADYNTIDTLFFKHNRKMWNNESRKILENLIVYDFKCENWSTLISTKKCNFK